MKKLSDIFTVAPITRTLEQGPPVNGADAVAGVQQVETLTIVATAGATSTGTISGNIFFCPTMGINSMVTYSVDMTTDTSAALIAEKLRAAYDAVTAINAAFILTRSGANIIATRRTAATNDASFVFSAGTGRGVSAGSSVNTTAGVAAIPETTATAVDQRCHVTDGGGDSLIYTATVAGVGMSKWKLTGPAGVQEDPNIPGAYVIAAPDADYATTYTTYTPS